MSAFGVTILLDVSAMCRETGCKQTRMAGRLLKKDVSTAVQYSALPQDLSDNEEEDDDSVVRKHKPHKNGVHRGHTDAQEEVIEMENFTLPKARVSRSDPDVAVRKGRMISKVPRCCFIVAICICIGLVVTVAFLLPCSVSDLCGLLGKSGSVSSGTFHGTKNWKIDMADIGSESCIRLVDVDEDGRLDILLGIGIGKDVHTLEDKEKMDKFCKSLGSPSPCAGFVIALRGYDGKELWRLNTYAEVFEINCQELDVNKDGKLDCIGSGRLSTLLAFDPRTGQALWRKNSTVFNNGWNNYNVITVPDVDGDTVPEIVVPHGGEPKFKPSEHVRFAGRLIMLSGATGHVIGQYLEMPDSKETYSSLALHSRKDGTQFILFGSGGETVPGNFLAISLADFFKHALSTEPHMSAPSLAGNNAAWPGKWKDPVTGIITIYKSDLKGVMVPPTLVDVTHDGVKDILMSGYDGTMALYNGETLETIWQKQFIGYESYSTPGVGYFDDDDILDFMSHWSHGEWPSYDHCMTVIQNGKTGDVMWALNTSKFEMSSPLVLRTTDLHRDLFIFRSQGREGKLHNDNMGETHGIDLQRPLTPRPALDKYQTTKPSRGQSRDEIHDKKTQNTMEPSHPMPEESFLGRGRKNQYEPPDDSSYDNNNRNKWPDDPNYPPYYIDQDSEGRKTTNSFSDYSERNYGQKDGYGNQYGNRQGYPGYPGQGESSMQENYGSDSFEGGRQRSNKYVKHNGHSVAKRHGEEGGEGHVTCDDDLKVLTTEVFAMDRTTTHNLARLWKFPATKHYYNNSEMVELLSGSLDAPRLDSNDPKVFCSPFTSQERTTGALGDVDGDGKYDAVLIVTGAALLHDDMGSELTLKYKTFIYKVNLEEAVHQQDMVPVNSTVSSDLGSMANLTALKDVGYLPHEQQPWTAYLGSDGNCVYTEK
ncbi:protein FAM234B isoform X1 [Lingula anatina]|uniref:Protein FAM234B isoform X1 n=1 Tax=Lingula anatina TaxID=7574 RepID=A0A1S3IY09_LINAN|nr:protein FAM234B isoform X1 [Lingula anatina]|eukprot:XP_013402918.1 protein FAM234B isoform X1 [Lingula anatina]